MAKRKKRGGAHGKKQGGALMGLRSGFKKAASGVAGAGPRKRSSGLGTVLTVLLVVAVAALLYYRRR